MKIAFIIHLYLMCSHLLSIIAWLLLLHEWINVLHSSAYFFSYSPFKLIHRSSMFLGFFSLALSLSSFQAFLIGFMSEIWAGNLITVTSSSERNVWTDFAVWNGALSYINTAGCSSQIRYNMFLHYPFVYSCVNFTLEMTRGPIPTCQTPSNFLLQI